MNINRKEFLEYSLLTISGIAIAPLACSQGVGENLELQNMLNEIGNSNSEKERAKLLGIALNHPAFSLAEKEIIKRIFFIADRWANGFEKYKNPGSEGNEWDGYLCGFLYDKGEHIVGIDRFFFQQVDERNPFFPLIAFYRSRILIAHLIQDGGINGFKEIREMYINESTRLLKFSEKAFPDNSLIKSYLGKYETWGDLAEMNQKAPEWANFQRLALEKLNWLIHWWIDNRQISDGQFGGGWGDDVEMWRQWVSILLAFEDEKAVKSQEKLFAGLYNLSKMEKGFTTSMHDVEHTAEEYSDPLTFMLTVQPDNPVWEQRALKVLDHIKKLWTGTNNKGYLQFKSTWFNVNRIDLDEKKACDTPYHTRMIQPLMLIWLRSGNEGVAAFVKSWLRTWVEATFVEENGKPYGIIPAAIHWPDGKPSGTGKKWWIPENYPTHLYDYPSKQEMMYECFLQAYIITKDEYYIKPLQFIAQKRLLGLGEFDAEEYTEGSLEWCISKLKGKLYQTLFKYRLLTGDTAFDAILNKDTKGYERFVFENDLNSLTQSLEEINKSMSLPKEFYTSEVRWTDRLFSFPNYFNHALQKPMPKFNSELLFSSLTGNIGSFNILPVSAVKWLTHPAEIAVLTEVNLTDRFEAQLFHFGTKQRKMGARFYNLDLGEYQLYLNTHKSGVFQFSEKEGEIEFTIPSQKLCKLIITKI